MNKLYTLIATLLLSVLLNLTAESQVVPLPYKFRNLSSYSNDSVYIGLVGRVENQGVWMDLKTMEINNIDSSWNTVRGPEGAIGALGSEYFASCFTPLSEIPDQTIQLPLIASVRIFIGFGEQMYLYFFDSGDYAGANLSNLSDPNSNVKFEMIELTYNNYGLWTNTTRVDHYQYPMGQEVWGADGFYKRVGEIISHEEIIEKWKTMAPEDFQACFETEKEIIHGPSKINEFKEGGASYNYYDDFVDRLWAEYSDRSLSVSIGDEGVWTGNVVGEEFRFTNASGTQALIAAKPNTQEVLEGKGVLASDEPSTPHIHADLNMQKHFCAAINRGAINLNVPSDSTVSWGNEANFFPEDGTPYNFYVKFWHMPEVSHEGQTYAFAYDDVFDFSSTTHTTAPDSVLITLGGFSSVVDDTLQRLELSPEYVDLMVGDTQQFIVKGYSQNNIEIATPNIVWEGCDENGLFIAQSAGQHSVNVSSGNITASSQINVETQLKNNTMKTQNVRIYPTLVYNEIHVENASTENYQIHIHSLTGTEFRKISTAKGNFAIDVSNLPNNAYIISIVGKTLTTKMFVKQ